MNTFSLKTIISLHPRCLEASMKSFLSFFFEIILIVAIAVAVVWPVRYFLVQPFFVKGASMEPTFDDGQYLVIDELSYRLHEPSRGDVVVFRYPLDPSQYYIKRVIGLPGETVEVAGGRVKIYNNDHPLGFVLDESSYLPPNVITSVDVKETISDKAYFVMGDNRSASSDSRRWGTVPADNIVGRVWFRAWPPQTVRAFPAPSYNY